MEEFLESSVDTFFLYHQNQALSNRQRTGVLELLRVYNPI